MAFVENLSEFFDEDDFAVAATFTPAGGSPLAVSGIFDSAFRTEDAGDGAGFTMAQPVFRCAAASVPGVAEGDGLVVGAKSYIVRVAEPDGTGEMTLILEEV